MISTCNHISNYATNRYDPTRTTVLRAAFVRDMRKRFAELVRVVHQAVVEQDCFGLRSTTSPQTLQLTPPVSGAFAFARSTDKVDAFMRWLDQQVDRGLLQVSEFQQVGIGIEGAWTNKYIADSYKRGVIRARYELQRSVSGIPNIEQTGGIDAVMGNPFHVDRLELLYSRTFNGLKGITTAMDTQISRILAQGIADGDHPTLLERKLRATIDGTGMGKLGITDSLGRFIPAKRRAEMLARTEIIHAHAEATLQEFSNWKLEGVEIVAEWVSANDSRMCERCGALNGEVFSIEQARGMIPLHPNCRCTWVPARAPVSTKKKK